MIRSASSNVFSLLALPLSTSTSLSPNVSFTWLDTWLLESGLRVTASLLQTWGHSRSEDLGRVPLAGLSQGPPPAQHECEMLGALTQPGVRTGRR